MAPHLFHIVLALWAVAFAATMGWAAALAGRRDGAEVMDFEPSDQFEMPEAMGIDAMSSGKTCTRPKQCIDVDDKTVEKFAEQILSGDTETTSP